MARYSIDGQILTELGDVLREKKGESAYHSSGTMKLGTGDWLDNTTKQTYKFTFTTTSIGTNVETDTGYIFFNSKRVSPNYTFTVGEVTEGFFTVEDIVEKRLLIAPASGSNNISGTYILELADENENVLYTYNPEEMVEQYRALPTGPAGQNLVISGSCDYRFYNGAWDWFIKNYGDTIQTADITSAMYMFHYTTLEYIPFEINFLATTTQNQAGNQIFFNAQSLKEAPKINYFRPKAYNNLFENAYRLRTVPQDFCDNWDFSYLEKLTSTYSGDCSDIFKNCYSLRSFPVALFAKGNPNINNSYGIYGNAFNNCYALDEIIDLPYPHTSSTFNSTGTSSLFYQTFQGCERLKNLTFKIDIPVNWTNQTLELRAVGYSSVKSHITGYNSGITADKEVKDDATYQALKNDPDWFATKAEYSRYNHDSAVATINSLPSAIEYQTANNKTANIISFNGVNGSATDGGAISNLTEAEIAVAAAKGWTVAVY